MNSITQTIVGDLQRTEFCNLTKRADLHSCRIDWLLGVTATFVFVGLGLQAKS